MSKATTDTAEALPGKVYLVGAGPGDPGLVTVRGAECLSLADVVLYDYLVNPVILRHAPASAERICLGRHGRTRIWPQEEINAVMVERARRGRTVVRLKGGDPTIFARGAEEVETLRQAGIEFEVVPGVTAAMAAAAYADVPITHRHISSAVALVTGQELHDKQGEPLDYGRLAQFPGTLIVYMGVTTVSHWAGALLDAGKSPDTPVTIVRRCSLSDQQTVHCTLGKLVEQLTPSTRIRPPVIVIIGPAAGQAPARSWFERRPLFGRTIMVTRPRHQCEALASRFQELGARVCLQPAIEIREPRDWGPVDTTLQALDEFHWLVFSSVNGVRAFLERLFFAGLDLRSLAGIHLAAIGPATADELRRYHLNVDVQPERFQAEDLAAALTELATGQRFLLARASRGREVLAEQLMAAGGRVTQVIVYDSADVEVPDPDAVEQLRAGTIDWVTVTSSAIARSLAGLFGDELSRARLASISPITSKTLRELGFEPAVEAEEATMPGIVRAILDAS